ncbi:MAG TPA: DNA helicase UvrD, partial [Actinobacteria bacterium]|nr:DNA helicase UvrD [Actinomycetota bacterium]
MTLSLSDLNPAQRDAVTTTEGPLLVLAGAGSGKTRVLTYRIANLIENHGVSPASILAITFTNKAAGEMRERLIDLVGPSARPMWVMTFHAFCVRLLRADGARLGYSRSFTIYDDDDSRRLLASVLTEL